MAWLGNIRESMQSRLWPVPTAAVVTALLAGVLLPELDAAISGSLSGNTESLLFGGDADAARSLLGAIAGSLITVTSLTFSLTVVTLQLASSQFSPRLLRAFTSDQFVQGTLAMFLATFTYALTVLRAVRSAGDGQAEFVPRASVTLAFVLAVVSVLALVLFLAHLTRQIRVETMLRNVHRDATRTMGAALTERGETSADAREEPAAPSDAHVLLAVEDGFLTWVAELRLLEVGKDEGITIRLEVYPGNFVVAGTPIGAFWHRDGAVLGEDALCRIARRVNDCLQLSFERTAAQDVGFGLRQLTDVANKALSPGINDPTTACHALDRISAFLCALTHRDLGDRLVSDEDDRVVVVLRRPDFAAYLDLGISQPRRYGAADPQVLARILRVLLDLSYHVDAAQRADVRDQLGRLRTTVAQQRFDEAELASLARLGDRIEENLRHPGSLPAGPPRN